MRWQDISREIAQLLQGSDALADQRPIIYVDSAAQLLYQLDIDDSNDRSYRISTAANGIGNLQNSNMTPHGVHRVRQKIGGGEPRGMVFKAREPTGRIARNLDNRDTDEITSRILWLDGLEPGVNRDGSCDTYARYIYIHGTTDERRIGQPVSAGCIRMLNDDVIELFDEVMVNDLVVIR